MIVNLAMPHNVLVLNQRRDPTQTTTLRNSFTRAMRKRFAKIVSLIIKAIVTEDVFGLREQSSRITVMQTPGFRRFAFHTSAEKVALFMDWLRREVENEVLQVTTIQQVGSSVNAAWTNTFIQDSYRRGVARARSQMIREGFEVPSLQATGGITASMNMPFHVDRLGLLYTRVFGDLKGITDAMDSQISRVLTQGIADGLNPRTLARHLRAVIEGGGADLGITDTLGRYIPARRRAVMLARTEIIRAHAEAQLQEFRNWRVEGVTVKAEWITAGDNRVCQQCADLQNSVFTIEQASGMIPLHPSCRCAWVPHRVIPNREMLL